MPAPSSRLGLFVIGLILVDLPVLLAVLVVGLVFGFSHTYEVVTEWRVEHPWSLIPSLVAAGAIVWRWGR